MRNLILILLLVLFFAFIYLLMSRIDRILDRLRQEAPDLPILLHGFDATAWDFVAAARDLGCDARIGLEDCLYLPDGRVAGNGALVAAAARTLGLDA